MPISIQTERAGHYTNFAGQQSSGVRAPCFAESRRLAVAAIAEAACSKALG